MFRDSLLKNLNSLEIQMTMLIVSQPDGAPWITSWKTYVTLLKLKDFLLNVCKSRKDFMKVKKLYETHFPLLPIDYK